MMPENTSLRLVRARIVDPLRGIDEIGDLYVSGGVFVEEAPAGAREIDCAGLVLCPGFVDLHASLPDPLRESAAAFAGGFLTVLAAPDLPTVLDRPSLVRDRLARAAGAPCEILLAGALTAGLDGANVADVGSLVAAGASALSGGLVPVRSARALRHLLETAGRFGRPILLRAADPGLEEGGVVREGPLASRLGLPSVPPEAEEIGVATVAAIVRRTGVPVHLTHLWSAKGVEALRVARDEGLPLTGSTTAHHLALGAEIVDDLAYAGVCRFVPPLGDKADREALAGALRDGTLCGVATDHRPVPLHLQDREFEIAASGQIGFETALSLVLFALGDPALAARALATGPAAILGRRPTLALGMPADLVAFDPAEPWIPSRETLRSSELNTPLIGRPLIGRVRWMMRKGVPSGDLTGTGAPGGS